ncbi:uncharacterized protein LOC113146446 [Cyclospora cayetanensis]|uniref:Uncharacterized protein LOC113146446 n=1 Tax=Cyclospora cayetanensis TaxID=88456 RepID=A0A6P6RR74_9EIME|nr:uncharacterized protein LOC113146446 [Cyclospora cayetanensis]
MVASAHCLQRDGEQNAWTDAAEFDSSIRWARVSDPDLKSYILDKRQQTFRADSELREVEFTVGGEAWISTRNLPDVSICSKLGHRYCGPILIVYQVRKVADSGAASATYGVDYTVTDKSEGDSLLYLLRERGKPEDHATWKQTQPYKLPASLLAWQRNNSSDPDRKLAVDPADRAPDGRQGAKAACKTNESVVQNNTVARFEQRNKDINGYFQTEKVSKN